MVKFNILGSCVCRDIFNFTKEDFKVVKYANGSALPSMCSDPPSISLSIEEFKFRSNFEKRCAVIDFNKASFEYISSELSDYIVISLSDNRIDLAELYDNCDKIINLVSFGTTFKDNYKEIDKLKNFSLKTYKALGLPQSFYYHYIDIFVQKLLQLYPINRIIVVEDFFTDVYYSKDNIVCSFPNKQYVKEINSFYSRLYSRLYARLNTHNIIKFPHNLIANEKHKLGLFGLHYVDEIYQYASSCIYEMVYGTFNERIGQLLKSEVEEKITNKYFNN